MGGVPAVSYGVGPMTPQNPSAARNLMQEAVRVIPDLARLGWRLVRDPRIPFRPRALAVGALAYVMMPFDIIPDFFPIIGGLDDVLLVALALNALIQAAGPQVLAEHWNGPPRTLEVVEDVIDWAAGLVPWPLRRALRGFLNQ